MSAVAKNYAYIVKVKKNTKPERGVMTKEQLKAAKASVAQYIRKK